MGLAGCCPSTNNRIALPRCLSANVSSGSGTEWGGSQFKCGEQCKLWKVLVQSDQPRDLEKKNGMKANTTTSRLIDDEDRVTHPEGKRCGGGHGIRSNARKETTGTLEVGEHVLPLHGHHCGRPIA